MGSFKNAFVSRTLLLNDFLKQVYLFLQRTFAYLECFANKNRSDFKKVSMSSIRATSAIARRSCKNKYLKQIKLYLF